MNFLLTTIGLRTGKIDLVQDRNDLESRVEGEKQIR
jgi:hypothetical protein